MDFVKPRIKERKNGSSEVYADFKIGRSTDLMVRSKHFHAIWDEEAGMWSTDEYDVQRLVDRLLYKFAAEKNIDNVQDLESSESQAWYRFRKYINAIGDNSKELDTKLTFRDQVVKKSDYRSRRLPYNLESGDIAAWNELIGTLYSPEEREKIEWSIGAIVSGDSAKIHKFIVLYGEPGTGKGTVIEILLKLFDGYTSTFEAKALVGHNNTFATEMFRGNPLVAIQHDGDLSRIEDNTKLNSIVSHELITFNEKFKPTYSSRVNAFLFMGSNTPVKISDSKSGLLRRLIDVTPTGVTIPVQRYQTLMSQIDFELGAIAKHCLNLYRELGKSYYQAYKPENMMYLTDAFYNFIESNWDTFKYQDGVSLKQAYEMYQRFCEEAGIDKPMTRLKVRGELGSYFEEFHDRILINGEPKRSYFKGFKNDRFKAPVDEKQTMYSLVLDETISLLNEELAEMPAQYSKANGTPAKYWNDNERMINGVMKQPKPNQVCDTLLRDIDTSQEHYVKVPYNHVVIDFDLKDEGGNKSLDLNLRAASEWPPTYAELSKGENGVHLHYIYDGDIEALNPVYGEGIEVKTLLGDASLRRRLTKCNNVPIANISSGLPFKEKKVLDKKKIESERHLRVMIGKAIKKEFSPGTKPSIDFIKHLLDEAIEAGVVFDVSDLKSTVVNFAFSSTNQAENCLRVVQEMRFKPDEEITPATSMPPDPFDDRIVFFDVEVFPNLFVICWKFRGSDVMMRMVNPTAEEVESLFAYRLVGFNNRRYDNHILYARYMNFSLEALYRLSQKIINKVAGAMIPEAYNLSYADIFDFIAVKQGLKQFGIDLGLHHLELNIPWNEPVPKDLIDKVVEYCCNDVLLTEATFEAKEQDFVARQILAELSGLSVNDPTAANTRKIIFGNNRTPQRNFVYTKLDTIFPGYKFDKYGKTPQEWMGINPGPGDKVGAKCKSWYRDEDPSEGGYVYAEPGMYENVAVLDIESMHPMSLIAMNMFGDYTPKFKALVDARLSIKHDDYESAREMMSGKLAPYLVDAAKAEALSNALKIVVNSVYGYTSASYENAFRDPRNIDNIVAKRGALFMIDLKHFVQEAGYQVVHIKTDSIKIPNAPDWLIEQIQEFGQKYGYNFKHEATYSKFCLVNKAVYIAKYGWAEKAKKIGTWDAVGAQFQHPYVYKMMFAKESISFDDLLETKKVDKEGSIYMDFTKDSSRDSKSPDISDGPGAGMTFIGRIGRFLPVREGLGGADLYRVREGAKPTTIAGTKGYRWLESSMAQTVLEEEYEGEMTSPMFIDMAYYDDLIRKAKKAIADKGDLEWFLAG